jgi:hypothetical protein
MGFNLPCSKDKTFVIWGIKGLMMLLQMTFGTVQRAMVAHFKTEISNKA